MIATAQTPPARLAAFEVATVMLLKRSLRNGSARYRASQRPSLWGSGISASADMMSLDATRHLWSARIEPRRRTPAVGTYTHVIDQWPIIYDNPVVLNQRQAGVAIEGALRQKIA